MDAKLQRRVQRYGWDKAASHYERSWQSQLEPAQSAVLDLAGLEPGIDVLGRAIALAGPQAVAACCPPGSLPTLATMPKWDQLRPLPDHVIAPLLRALMCISARPESRLVLKPVTESRPPFWTTEHDYMLMFPGAKVGRIDYDHRPYAGEEHARWHWFLNDTQRNRMASGRCTTREHAMAGGFVMASTLAARFKYAAAKSLFL